MLMAIYFVIVSQNTFLINVHFIFIFVGLSGWKTKTMRNSIAKLLFYKKYSLTFCTQNIWRNYPRLKIASVVLVTAR